MAGMRRVHYRITGCEYPGFICLVPEEKGEKEICVPDGPLRYLDIAVKISGDINPILVNEDKYGDSLTQDRLEEEIRYWRSSIRPG